MKIFDLDGPVYKAGVELSDALILTVIWFIGCLPIITIGTSTSALFYIYGKKARDEDAYIWRDFWKSYRQNFVQSIPITLILGVMWASTVAYRILIEGYEGGAPILLTGLALLMTVEVMILTIYVLAVLSRFHMKVMNMFLTAFVLAHRHIISTALIIVGVVLLQYASLVIPFTIMIMPVFVAAVASVPIQKIFTKHIQASAEMKAVEEAGIEDDEEAEEIDEEGEDDEEESNDFLKYI
ncbi:MAG: YesL family protein [Cellulosilyticaceae bacterium]